MKRTLSIILTLCMIISLLPTFSLVGAAETYAYNFNGPTTKSITEVDYADTDNMWKYVTSENMYSGFPAFANKSSNSDRFGLYVIKVRSTASSWWVALEVNVPSPGEYKSTLGYRPYTNSRNINVYVLPKGTTLSGNESFASLEGAVKLNNNSLDLISGTVDSTTKIAKHDLDETFETTVPNEKRIVVFEAAENNSKQYAYIANFTITKQGGEAPPVDTCNVTFNANGGIGIMAAQTLTKDVAANLNENAFTYEGHIFAGWNTKADGTGASYADKASFTATENITLYAQWSVDPNAAKKYTYKFNPKNTNKEAVNTYTYADTGNTWEYVAGKGISASYPQTMEGSGIRTYPANGAVGWAAFKLRIPAAGTYNVNLAYSTISVGGIMDVYVLPKDATLVNDESIETIAASGVKLNVDSINTRIGTTKPVNEQILFEGQITTTSPDEERIIVFSDSYIAANSYLYLETLTLAQDDGNSKREFKIAYDADGGATTPAGGKAEENSVITLPAALEREGYTFMGWNDGQATYEADSTYVVKKNAIFTAQWEEIPGYEFTITYDANGGTFGITTVKASHGVMNLPKEVPTAVGQRFIHWSDGTTIYYAGEEYNVTKNVTFTAQWEEYWGPPEGATYADDRIIHALDTKYENFEGQAWTNPSYIKNPSLYSSASRGINDICGFEEGHGITSDYTDGWSWHSYDKAIKKTDMTFHVSNGKFMRATIASGQWYALKTTFETAGIYRVALNYLAYSALGAADVYLIPVPEAGEKVEDYLTTNQYKIGDFDCYDKNIPAWDSEGAARSKYLGDAYVEEPGERLIIFRGKVGKSKNGLIFINDIVFSGASPVTGIETPGKALAKGESLTLSADMLSWEANVPEYTDNCEITYVNETPDILELSGNIVTAKDYGAGKITIKVRGTQLSYEAELTLDIIVGSAKERQTYYTEEKIQNARNNIKRYDWARDQMKAATEKADEYVRIGEEKLWNIVTTQGLPRAQRMNARYNDTGYTDCIYCGKELSTQYGERPWEMDQINNPWKLQCPECRKSFPSNDFESFYELGIDENANWSYERALQEHHKLFVCANGENCTCTAPTLESPKNISDVANLEIWMSGSWRTDEWKAYYGYGKGFLKNNEFTGTDANGRVIDDTYCVDDGWGYDYIHTIKMEDGSTQTEKRIEPFIAFYNYHGIWGPYGKGIIYDALKTLSEAYVYTGATQYGRLGAILVDRVADAYKDFNCNVGHAARLPIADNSYKLSAGKLSTVPRGILLGKLHDTTIATHIVKAYDAFWPALKDAQPFLSEKARMYGFENLKEDEIDIARNIENNVLRVLHKSRLEYRYDSNFPLAQAAHILAGVVLDTSPESEEYIDFEFRSGGKVAATEYTGGNITAHLYEAVTRDGHGNEAAPGYNAAWVKEILNIGEVVGGYDRIPAEKKTEYDIFSNPKVIRMLTAEVEILCVTTASPNIGDHDKMGRQLYGPSDKDTLITAYQLISDEEMKKNIARLLYRLNGKKIDNMHGNIFMAEPEGIVDEIGDIVKETSSAIILPSEDFAGYGLSIMRAGNWFVPDSPRNVNTQRNFYIWYGVMDMHGHPDKLNLGVYAYGLEVGADPGEAEVKDSQNPHRWEFDAVTHSHNTVTVNNLSQRDFNVGYPRHFDDSGRVQVSDVEAADVYDWLGVDEYRRTVVMVDANDDISYGVDFFHVSGGEDHLYSFHALGREAELLNADGTEMGVTSQKDENDKYVGSYQGVDKGWGDSYINSIDISNQYGGQYGIYDIEAEDFKGNIPEDLKRDGLGIYSWFGEVDRADNPENADVFSMDWKIVDRMHALNPVQRDLRVRLTMLNSFKLDEIATTSAIPADNKGEDDTIRYLFARHTGAQDGKAEGEKLDTLFTSVVEPYNKDRYIDKIEKVDVTRADGTPFTTDEAKAVKVTLTNGRVDYIVYAKDTTVAYKVHYKTLAGENKTFDFCGFVGVVSMVNDKVIYSYVNDGEAVADKSALTPAYTGRVEDFQREITTNNYIDVSFEQEVDEAELSNLAGRYIYVDNDHTLHNGSYRIEKAEAISGGVRLYVGNTALIINVASERIRENRYNVEEGQTFRIPLSYVDDGAPIFETLNNVTTTAGNSTTATVKANSEDGIKEYAAVTLPRGASFDGATGMVTWKPDESQIGDNVVQIDAIDNSGRVSRINFAITVYGKTTGADEGTTGGGGGGGAPLPDDDTDKDTATDDTPNTGDGAGDESGEGTETGTEDGSLRFIDLASHAWAVDAINALAEAGVIKGTSENEYSPANNITRADYAILLVRAFDQTSDNTENFDDVKASDYFAHELAIARNTGIVGGIGNNMFAPRKNIMRQDMMLMTYRALKALGIELTAGEVEAPDLDKVDEYALDAVRALISNGLVNGKNGYIDPKANTTRAEVAVLLKRILDFAK